MELIIVPKLINQKLLKIPSVNTFEYADYGIL